MPQEAKNLKVSTWNYRDGLVPHSAIKLVSDTTDDSFNSLHKQPTTGTELYISNGTAPYDNTIPATNHFYWPSYPYYPDPVVYPTIIYRDRIIERDNFKDWLIEENMKSQSKKISELESTLAKLSDRLKSLEAEKESWSKKRKK